MTTNDRDASLRLYMQEISKHDLLTQKEEIELAERIEKGDEVARTKMINANLRLVVKIAQEYSNYGVPLQDLISEGNIGLMKAVDRFDVEVGSKLSTYAAWWIKQSIKRALANQSKTVRLPVHMIDKITKVRKISDSMAESLGREPSDHELAEEIGISRTKLALIKQASYKPASLDAPLYDDDSASYSDTIGDDKAVDPALALSNKNMQTNLDDLFNVLDEREQRIIDARFGLAGQKPKTLEEVGVEFGVTRERIRQLQNLAVSKMRKALGKLDRPLPSFIKF
ncbi:RNA polymerase sigma factor RpoD/SigA [Akkermansiaceae bacterium]|nr:RNA polymerase sigma factor RpoD/SigA [Akkermansiaceae bacterium]